MLQIVTPPAAEPITLSQAKAHLRVDGSDEDTYITSLIRIAREYAEHDASRAFATQTVKETFPAFADSFELARGPVVSVSSVKYLDSLAQQQTASTSLYYLDQSGLTAVLRLVPGQTWPTSSLRTGGIEITYVTGTWPSDPTGALQFILLLIGTMYAARESDAERAMTRLPFADRLLDPYRVPAAG